jgi:hypothetical protein
VVFLLLRRSVVALPAAALALAGLAVAAGPAAGAATTPYRVQQTPRINGLLASVSCAGKSFCAAATSFSLQMLAPVPKGAPSVLVRTAAGGPWRIPRGAVFGLITGLSCSSASFCLAIGMTGAHRWDGSRWTAVAAPPGPATTPLGRGEQRVSCVSRTFCMAVGLTDGPHAGPAASVWDGTSWHATVAPKTPAGAGIVKLDGVSCPTKTVCFASGKYRKDGLQFTLVERWNGSTWVIHGPATRLSPVSVSMDLSCASATACMAVWGDYRGGGKARWWNGSVWKGTTLAGPSGAFVTRGILSVSCATATSCTGVGDLTSGDPRTPAPLIEHWDGRAWTRTASALPASGHAALGGVSCTAARVCTAVGFKQPGAAPFAEARRS